MSAVDEGAGSGQSWRARGRVPAKVALLGSQAVRGDELRSSPRVPASPPASPHPRIPARVPPAQPGPGWILPTTRALLGSGLRARPAEPRPAGASRPGAPPPPPSSCCSVRRGLREVAEPPWPAACGTAPAATRRRRCSRPRLAASSRPPLHGDRRAAAAGVASVGPARADVTSSGGARARGGCRCPSLRPKCHRAGGRALCVAFVPLRAGPGVPRQAASGAGSLGWGSRGLRPQEERTTVTSSRHRLAPASLPRLL